MDLNDELFQRAQISIPGGVNSPVRAFRSVGGSPRFIDRAKGPYMWDATGKQFIDYILSWGPMILGHNNDEVIAAVDEAVSKGLSFGAVTQGETLIAEEVRKLVPSMDQVRLVSSGTEAGMSAIRLARGYTGRNKIIKFEGCYHGHSDSLLVKAGSGMLTFGNPSSAGVPASVTEHTLVLEYNNPQQLEDAFAQWGDDIACVIVEAVAGNMNMVRGNPEFLRTMRELCTKHGAVLIVDEVMTGFRVAQGGAQAFYGIEPDLTMLGKVIGGGMPVAAFGGRREIMQQIAPLGLPGRHAFRQPRRRRLRSCDPQGHSGSGLPRQAFPRRRPPRQGPNGRRSGKRHHVLRRQRRRHVRPLLPAVRPARLRRRDEVRHGDVQPLLPRHARARRLLRPVRLRGRLRLDHAHRRSDRRDHRRRSRDVC